MAREADFDWGDTVIRKMKSKMQDLDKGIDGLSTEPKLKLLLDSHGILEDKKRIARNQLACELFCIPPVISCCVIACNWKYFEVLFNQNFDKEVEAASG